MESGYYPAGAEFDTSAPWNQNSLPEKEIEVMVSITLSKPVKISVDDYSINVDETEDGQYLQYDFSDCNLEEAVKNQIALPQDLAEYIDNILKYDEPFKGANIPKHLKDAIEDCKGWNVDDYEIILE